jgi:hypothetical protein
MKTSLKMASWALTCVCFLTGMVAYAADTNTVSTTNAAARLMITKATWGDPSDSTTSSDVTEQVAGMVTNDTLRADASNDNFGDPASGVCKLLKVDFTFDGMPGSKSVYERGTLTLSILDKPKSLRKTGKPGLVIRSAVYGVLPDGDKIDVTSIIAGMVQSNSLDITVTNSDLGDPAPYQAKKLLVDYTLYNKDGSQMVPEGGVLKISAGE